MEYESMSRDELINHIKKMKTYMDNVLVFWGGRREFHQTLEEVARSDGGEFTDVEQTNAAIILKTEGAFDQLIELIRDSFERGGINYVVSEKVSALMEDVAERYRKSNN
jgi:hypothetical protein